MPVGAGIAVAGVASGVASSRAASKAAKAGERGAERSGAQIQAAADTARTDVLDFFPAAQRDLLAGAGAAGGLLTQGIGEQQRLFSAGNVGAQGTLQGGFGQVQNALLGLPVNQQAFAPQQIQLSQIPQNPLAQQLQPTQQQPAQPAGQPAQPAQGLFTDIAQVQPAAQQQRLEGVTSNADVLNNIISGELNIPGVNTGFINAVVSGQPNSSFLNSTNLLDLARTGSTEEIERFLSDTGFNNENKSQFRQIIVGLKQQLGVQ